jgi:putative endonuclease
MESPKLTFKQKVGNHIEQLACNYLIKNGLILIQKNFKSRMGEIDLIMWDKDTIAFIEVRYRRSDAFGGALGSIDWRKQKRIINTANDYLYKFRLTEKYPCRFDVVIVSGSLQMPEIEWILQAF